MRSLRLTPVHSTRWTALRRRRRRRTIDRCPVVMKLHGHVLPSFFFTIFPYFLPCFLAYFLPFFLPFKSSPISLGHFYPFQIFISFDCVSFKFPRSVVIRFQVKRISCVATTSAFHWHPPCCFRAIPERFSLA